MFGDSFGRYFHDDDNLRKFAIVNEPNSRIDPFELKYAFSVKIFLLHNLIFCKGPNTGDYTHMSRHAAEFSVVKQNAYQQPEGYLKSQIASIRLRCFSRFQFFDSDSSSYGGRPASLNE